MKLGLQDFVNDLKSGALFPEAGSNHGFSSLLRKLKASQNVDTEGKTFIT